MELNRRQVLRAGVAAALGTVSPPHLRAAGRNEWETLRQQFDLDWSYLHFAGLLLASHPRSVRDAIDRHRKALDRNPVLYLQGNKQTFEDEVRRVAARYLDVSSAEIALTDSTTMGLGLLYSGISVAAGQEILTTTHDHQATHDSIRLRAERTGASWRRVSLFRNSATATESEIVANLEAALTAKTRVVAVTWVHSSTGMKLPIRAMADAIASRNRYRDERNRILFCVDGVHGLGNQNLALDQLGCDFYVAGTHKWLFGPRGTGLVWGRRDAWRHVTGVIPTFSGTATPGQAMTPGGYHSFEHRWALKEAFEFHLAVGKARIARRIADLNTQLKQGLRGMSHVTLYTPMDEALSAGIVCLDVRGYSPSGVVSALRSRKIIASTTPYSTSYARLTPGLLNTPEEVDKVLSAIRSL